MKISSYYISANDIYPKELLKHAQFYRDIALTVDRDPTAICEYFNHPSIQFFITDKNSSCIERTQRYEALSYGDAGVLLAAPGPALAGQLLNELGNEEQKEYFYNFVKDHTARTFLAVTEPNHGSDAANIETCIHYDNREQCYYLSGEKCFIGNGATGDIGIVIAKQFRGPLGFSAVMITPKEITDPTLLSKNNIATVGLAGASLSYLKFTKYPIRPTQLLGAHLRVADRGFIALLKTFNRMRSCVGALALGTTQAVLDYVHIHRKKLSLHESQLLLKLNANLCVVRRQLYKAAMIADQDPFNSAVISLAKYNATTLAESVIQSAIKLFDENVFWEHPLIEKWSRDVYGFEFMEGTSNIHLKNVFQGYVNQHTNEKNKYD